MKLKRYIAASFGILLLGAGFASCDDEVEYSPVDPESDANAYFDADGASKTVLQEGQASVEFPIYRTSKEGSLTVGIECTASASFFEIPSSVTFDDGKDEASIKVSFPFSSIQKNVAYTFDFSIEEGKASIYGSLSAKTFTLIYETWTSLGYATYVDDFVTTFFNAPSIAYQVEIQENSELPGVYRLVNPYGKPYPYNVTGDYNANEDSYMVINAVDPDRVYIETSESSMDWGYGKFIMSSDAYMTLLDGATADEVDEEGLFGTLANGMITFPKGTLLIAMAGYNNGSFYYANLNGKFLVAFPGVDIKDYEVTATYNGIFIDPDDKPYVIGDISMGDDVDLVRVAAVPTDYEDEAYQAVTAGTCSYSEIRNNGSSHSVQLPLESTGDYTLIVVSYANDEPKQYAFAKFTYRSADDGNWEDLGLGVLADGWITPFMSYSDETQVRPEDFPFFVQIDRSLDEEGIYRMVEPYTSTYAADQSYPFICYTYNENPKKVNIIFDVSDPSFVLMDKQVSGYSNSKLGQVSIGDYATAALSKYDKETLQEYGINSILDTDEGIVYIIPCFWMDNEGPYTWNDETIMSMILLPEEGESANGIAARYKALRHDQPFASSFKMSRSNFTPAELSIDIPVKAMRDMRAASTYNAR